MSKHAEPPDNPDTPTPGAPEETGLIAPQDHTPQEVVARRRGAIASLAGTIGHKEFPPGDRAALRRLDVDSPSAPAFWRLLLERVPEEERRTEDQERRWAAIMNGLALMAPAHHQPGARLGAVLAGLDYSELRLTRLLRARWSRQERDAPAPHNALSEQVRRLSRFLAAKGRPVDWTGPGLLLLAAGEDSAEHQRRAIARDYYQARRQASRTAP